MNILNQNLVLGLLSCALIPGVASTANAQTPVMYAMRQSETIPVKHVNATIALKEALVRLKKFQNVRIAYKEGLLDGKTIPANLLDKAENMETEAALRLLLSDFSLAYMRINKSQYSIYNAETNAGLVQTTEVVFADKLKGKVIGPDGNPVPGATISVKGKSSAATVAGADGSFELDLKGATAPVVLVITSIGFEKQEVTVTDLNASVAVNLSESNKSLSEVVVTALGVKKEKKALVYGVTEVKGSDFTQAREVNVANSLTGKVAGVNATSLASGPGGSSRVVIRGNTSLAGDNQPLYVVNGMPIDNSTPGGSASPNGGGQNVDRGDGIGGINPDDIETLTVLKGGTAAALYGSRASNGVILITTKKGYSRKGIGVDYNTTYTAEMPMAFTDYQYEYGQGQRHVRPTTKDNAVGTGRLSFGEKMDGVPTVQFDGVSRPYSPQKDNIKNFYRTGSTYTNTVAFNGGNEAINFRFSLSNVSSKSVVPNSDFNKKIGNLNLNAKLGKRTSIEAVAQYNVENAKNRSSSGDANGNPNWGVYMVANTVDVRNMNPGYDSTGAEVPWNPVPYASNPYFVVNKFRNNDTKNRFIGQASVRYDLLKNLFVKGTVSRDFYNFDYVGIIPTGAAYTFNGAGEYTSIKSTVAETNSMLTATYNTKFANAIGLNVFAGGNARRYKANTTTLTGTQFIIPYFYTSTNLVTSKSLPARNNIATNSLFGSVDLDYKSIVFLTLTGRQEWFSTLSPKNNSIFYPAVGTSVILSDAFKMPKAVTFAKLRASWAQVGGATPDPYILNQTYSIVPGGNQGTALQEITKSSEGVNLVTNSSLKPLTATTFEVGAEAQFFNNRLGFDVTLYNKKTTNDIVQTAISMTSGYNKALLNVGQVSNKGIEVLLTGTPIRREHFTWNVSYNFAYNRSEIVQLAAGLNTLEMAQSVGGWAFIHNTVGQPYGIIKGYTILKNEKGETIFGSNGLEQRSQLMNMGNGVPPLTMGITNSFTYKRFNFETLIDGKFGNKVFSGSDVYATRFGLHKSTLIGREDGIVLTGVNAAGAPATKEYTKENIQDYYEYSKNFTDRFLYDGSFVKLRQVVLGYNIPVKGQSIVQSASISFVARNLLILYKKTDNFDPEASFTNGNAQGFEAFGIPRTRSFGANLMVKF